MNDSSSNLKRRLISLFLPIGITLILGGTSIAFAALTFTGTSISGDLNVGIDGSSTIAIGTSTATGITIGRTGVTTTFPGNVSFTGTLAGALLSANNLSDLTSTSSARISIGLNNLANALQLIAASNLSDLTSTSSARANLGFSGGNKITISPTGAIGLATSSISQFLNDAGYVTSTGGGGGSITTSSAVSANNFTFWVTIGGALSGTSTLSANGATVTQASGFNIGGNLNVTGTAAFNSTLSQTGGIVSLASTTINGNATTTGNLAVLGSLLDASGNKYSTSTGGTSNIYIPIALSDEVTPLATGTSVVSFRSPAAFTLTNVRLSLVASSSAGIVQVNVKDGGTSVFSTLPQIDQGATTSKTSGTQVVISNSSIGDDDPLTIDITAAGTNATGLKVWLIGH